MSAADNGAHNAAGRLDERRPMNDIRWGIIGCGDVTERKSGPAFQLAEGSSLVAVMRRNGALAADYAHRHNVGKWYDNAEALINDPQVDAVYVATPPSSHRDYAIAVAKAGKPVYVEKPMAVNYAQCVEMINACQECNIPLFVAYYRRALPRFLKIKALLEEGAIGQVRFADVVFHRKALQNDRDRAPNWRVNPDIAGGGYFYDVACHSIDILQFLLGQVQSATGYSSNQAKLYAADDIVSGLLVFENLAHASFVWDFNAGSDLDRTEIVGDKGKMTFSTFGSDPILLENAQGTDMLTIDNPHHIQQPLIQTIVDQLCGRGKCPSTGLTGARTNWIMDRMTPAH